MGRKSVPVKTNEGAQEIKARALGLAPRIRTALLLVDGVKSVAELERLMSAAGVTTGALQLLLDKGLIRFQEELTENSIVATAPEATDFTIAPTIFAPIEANVTILSAEATGSAEHEASPPIANVAVQILPPIIVSPKSEPARAPIQVAGSLAIANLAKRGASQPVMEVPAPIFPPIVISPKSEPARAPVQVAASLAVANLIDLETILGEATKLEIKTILGVATKLELTPTQLLAPNTVVKVFATEPPRLPPLAQATQQYLAAPIVQKQVMPAAVLRMNLTVARAHVANALDQFVEIDGYALKQKVVACESRADLEQLFRLVESALIRKIDKPAVARVMGIAQSLLER